jgi:hypothetical protein
MVRPLQREPGLAELQFRAHEISFVQNFPEREVNHTLSTNQLFKALGCSPSRVKAELAKGLGSPKVRGRHPAIDEGSEAKSLEWIEA